MNTLFRTALWLTLAITCVAHASTTDETCSTGEVTAYVPPPGMANDAQLGRVLLDYKMGTILKATMLSRSIEVDTSMLGGVLDELKASSDAELVHALLPSLRGHVSADDADKLAELLETDSGRAMINYLVATVSDPLHAPPRPVLDKTTETKFRKNGGLAALKSFAAYLQTTTCKQQMLMALLHYITRPQTQANV